MSRVVIHIDFINYIIYVSVVSVSATVSAIVSVTVSVTAIALSAPLFLLFVFIGFHVVVWIDRMIVILNEFMNVVIDILSAF